jgi:hypothetical protein
MSGGSVEPRLGRPRAGWPRMPTSRQAGRTKASGLAQLSRCEDGRRGEEHKGRLDEGDDGAELREKAGDI